MDDSIIKINNFESPLIIGTQIRLRALKKYILNAFKFKKKLVHTFILDVHHKWFLIRRLSTTYHLVDGMTGIIPHFSHIDSQNRSCVIGKRLPLMALDNLDHKLYVLAIPNVDADKNMVSFNLLCSTSDLHLFISRSLKKKIISSRLVWRCAAG